MDDWLDDDEKVRQAADAIRAGGGDGARAKLQALSNAVYAKRKGYEFQQQVSKLKALDEVDKSLGRLTYINELPIQPATLEQEVLEGKKALSPPEQERVAGLGATLGAGDPRTGVLGRQHPDFGTDIEGARERYGDQAVEVIRGGQRGVADKATTRLLAVRKEDPSVEQLWDELKKPKDMRQSGWLDLFGAVLDAPVKAAATAATRALASATGDEERIAKGRGWGRDLWRSAVGSDKDATISAGGTQAAREYGWGDFMRYAVKRYQETGGQGKTLGDVVLWATGGWDEGSHTTLASIPGGGALTAIMDRPLSDMEDQDYEQAGLLSSLVLDPLNFLPTKGAKGTALAREGGYQATRLAEKVAPKTAAKLGDWALRHSGPLSEARAYRALRKAGDSPADAREGAAQIVDWAHQGSHGTELVRMQQEANKVRKLIGKLKKTEQDALVDVIENGLRRLDDGGLADMLRTADASRASASTRRTVHAANSLDDEAMRLLRMTDDEVAELGKAARGGDDVAEELFEKVVDARTHFKQSVKPGMYRALEELKLNPFAEALDLGKMRTAGAVPDRVLDVARQMSRLLASVGEEAQGLGVLSKNTDLGNYFPHIVREMLGYSPQSARRLSSASELVDLRVAAKDVLADPASFGFAGDALARLDAFVKAPIRQQAGMLDEMRGLLGKEEVLDDLQHFGDLMEARYAGTMSAEKDVRRAFGRYLEVMHPMMARARVGQRLLDVEAGGGKMVRTVADALAEHGGEAKGWIQRGGDGKWKLTKDVFTTGRDAKGVMYINEVKAALTQKGYKVIAHGSPEAKKVPALRGMIVKEEIARELELMLGKQSAEAMDYAFKLVGNANKYWVPLLLNTPGFHVRNWLYGVAQGYLFGGAAMFANVRRTRIAHAAAAVAEHGSMTDEVIKLGKAGEIRVKDLAEELVEMGLVETGRIADLERIAQRSWSFKGSLGKASSRLSPFSERGLVTSEPLFKRLVNRPLARVQGAFGKTGGLGTASIENMQRAQLYAHLRAKGFSKAQAAEQTVKAFFDYTGARLGPMGKRLRQVLPFYQWLRYSNVQIVEAMLRHPDRFARMNRVVDHLGGLPQGEDPGLMPQHALERGGVHMPSGLAGVARAISERVLPVDPRVPGDVERASQRERAMVVERPGPNFLDLMHLPSSVAEQMGLLPSMAYELSTGKYLFGDMPLDPGYSQYVDEGGEPNMLERIMKMRTQEMPRYLLPKLGGPNVGLVAGALMPPTVGRNSDVDQAEKQLWRTGSWLGMPKVVPFQPSQVAERQGARFDEARKEIESAQRGRLKTDPQLAPPSAMQTMMPGLLDNIPEWMLPLLLQFLGSQEENP